MIYTTMVTCPKYDCNKKSNVVIEAEHAPELDRYEYACPQCKSRVLFIPTAIVESNTMPPDSVNATLRE